jgi:hypothetical protein
MTLNIGVSLNMGDFFASLLPFASPQMFWYMKLVTLDISQFVGCLLLGL